MSQLTTVVPDSESNVEHLLVDPEWAARGAVQITVEGVAPVVQYTDSDGNTDTIPLLKQQSSDDGLSAGEAYAVEQATPQIEEIHVPGVEKGVVAIDYEQDGADTIPRLVILDEYGDAIHIVELARDDTMVEVPSRFA